MSARGVDLESVAWPLRTARTSLRPVSPDDLDAIHAYRGLPEVATYLGGGPLTRDEMAARIADDIARGRAGHPEPLLGLVVEVDDAVVGNAMVRLVRDDDNGMWVGELGYTIHPDFAGQGLATEVAGALVRLCFTELGVAMVRADVFVPHRASQRVLEKVGMLRVAEKAAGSDGEGRPRPDDYVYAVTAAEWAASRSSGQS